MSTHDKIIMKYFDFNTFFQFYHMTYPDKKPPSTEFLIWFIGFFEGKGCLTVGKRGDLSFNLTQSTSDVKILYYILENLGFGNVIIQSKTQHTHKYVVSDSKSLHLICLLLNGNLVFPIKNLKFLEFLMSFNLKQAKNYQREPIQPILTTVTPTLKDYWLTGFTDSEGIFTASILSNSKAVRIRFILPQKWDFNKPVFEHILSLFKSEIRESKAIGAVVPNSEPQNYELRINGIKNCEYLHTFYFDKFPLKTLKLEDYKKWWNIVEILLKQGGELNPELRKNLIAQSKGINL